MKVLIIIVIIFVVDCLPSTFLLPSREIENVFVPKGG